MQLIRNNLLISFALFVSINIHLVLLLYHNSKPVIQENIVYFELVKQTANTNITASDTQSEKEEIEKTEEKVEEVKQVKEIKKPADIPKKAVQKKETAKKEVKKPAKQKQDIVKSKGADINNNQAEMYIKQNYTNIHKQIIGSIIYPPRAKKLGIEGSGYLLLTINQMGNIIDIQAFDFPNKLLKDAAIKAAKKASKTASHQLSSNVVVKIPVTFRLK